MEGLSVEIRVLGGKTILAQFDKNVSVADVWKEIAAQNPIGMPNYLRFFASPFLNVDVRCGAFSRKV